MTCGRCRHEWNQLQVRSMRQSYSFTQPPEEVLLESDLDIHRTNRDNCRKMLEAYPNDKCAAAIVDEEEGQIKVKCFELVDLREEYYKKIIRVADFVRNRVWDCE